MTWDDLDLYYGHKAQEMILTDVSDTIHADSLALLALNIEILLADVTNPEKSKILTLTWPVTSSVTSGSNFSLCTGSSRTGLSNGVWNLEIGPVVWEISGGALWAPPPPAGRFTNQTPAGRGLRDLVDSGSCRLFVVWFYGSWISQIVLLWDPLDIGSCIRAMLWDPRDLWSCRAVLPSDPVDLGSCFFGHDTCLTPIRLG